MSELQADDLSVAYGDTVAVHPLDLLVPGGRMLSVTGPSGAGKSSLLWALARAIRPAAASVTGTVRVGGSVLDHREGAARAGVVLVPQRNGLGGTLSAEESVLVPLLALGVPAARRCAASPTRLLASAWPSPAVTSSTSCPAASSSGWRWPGRSPFARRCCSPTSRPATWTPATGS